MSQRVSSLESNQRQSESMRLPDPSCQGDGPGVLVSVVMPCLNEARTLAACIEQAHTGCQAAIAQRLPASLRPASGRGAFGAGASGKGAGDDGACSSPSLGQLSAHGLSCEIVIADNGSTDGSQEIAVEHGAIVVDVETKGYGAALLGGIAAAQGKYVVMGDSDCSYDFGEVPRFLDKLDEGYALVVGNRFAGGIDPGAMPWHHRYIGNPLLSGLGRLLYRTPIRDWHCGLRALDRAAFMELDLDFVGMEFASGMIVRAHQNGLRIAEVPTKLRRDGRDRRPHLRSFRDAGRHVALLLKLRFLSS